MDEETYRYELRNHFMGQMKNSKFQSPAQHYKTALQQKMQDYEANYQGQRHKQHQHMHQHHQQQHRSSGGDADRVLYESTNFASQNSEANTYRQSNNNTSNNNNNARDNNLNNINNNDSNYFRQLHSSSKPPKPLPPMQLPPPSLPMPSSAGGHKYLAADDAVPYMYDTDSQLGGGGGGSEESGKSQKSSKTIISKKSSHDLRKRVKSQCKLHEVIDETLKQMCSTEGEQTSDEVDRRLKEQALQMPIQQVPVGQMGLNCKRCTVGSGGREKCQHTVHTRSSDKVQARFSQKDVMTEIAKGDFLDCRSGDTLTISVDDVVNSKVINPMIRKLQRMYLNNLREEMSLMEDLERLPHKVNEVYKATIFKQKD